MEDSELVRREIERLLRTTPGVTEIASCGSVASARELLADGSYDAWVLDFHLGDGTALDLLDERDEARVVVVTAQPTEGVRERCLGAGVDRFIDKADGMAVLGEALTGPGTGPDDGTS